ncbi:MAG TPA: YncE family protein [Nitrososphaeraceae archaeon]|nr:YncE family protein [Nitrososphaeraceae archaeon]
MENIKSTILLTVSYFLSICILVASLVITVNSVFSQTQQEVSHVTEVTNDSIFTTLRKDGAIYNLKQNITFPAGKDMTYIDAIDNGKVIVATSSADNQTFIFNNTENNLIAKIKVGDVPKGIKISPNGNYVFVANELDGTVSIINLKNSSVIKNIPVGKLPHNIVFSPDGLKAYVTDQGEDKIIVIDTNSFEIINEIQDS